MQLQAAGVPAGGIHRKLQAERESADSSVVLCSVSLSAEAPHLAVCVGVCGGLSGDGSLQAVGRRRPLAGDRTRSDF